MRILVLGAGGIGGFIGGRLAYAGQDVTLCDQWAEHVLAMQTDGLAMRARDGFAATTGVRALHLSDLQRESFFDVIVLAVKIYDTEWTAMLARRHLKPDGVVLVCQNGMTDEVVAGIVGEERTVGCVVTLAGSLDGPGAVSRGDAYPVAFRLGELSGPARPRTIALAEMLDLVGTTKTTDNLSGERWAKLATNCMVNALCGISGYDAGEVRSRDDTLSVLVELGAETVRVGRACGYDIEPIMGLAPQRYIDAAEGIGTDQLLIDIRVVSKATGGHRASMLQDVEKHRRTEIEFLNGLVADRGRDVGVATPLCDAAVAAVRRFPIGELEPDPANLVELVELAAAVHEASQRADA